MHEVTFVCLLVYIWSKSDHHYINVVCVDTVRMWVQIYRQTTRNITFNYMFVMFSMLSLPLELFESQLTAPLSVRDLYLMYRKR